MVPEHPGEIAGGERGDEVHFERAGGLLDFDAPGCAAVGEGSNFAGAGGGEIGAVEGAGFRLQQEDTTNFIQTLELNAGVEGNLPFDRPVGALVTEGGSAGGAAEAEEVVELI